MRVQIDTEDKTIRILNRINLADFITAMEKILGDDFFEYSIDVNSTYVTWTNPYYYTLTSTNANPDYLKWPTITSNSGTYNVEIRS